MEGHVNRIKMLKRQMYGRANLDLLRKRVLMSRLPVEAELGRAPWSLRWLGLTIFNCAGYGGAGASAVLAGGRSGLVVEPLRHSRVWAIFR